MSYLEFEKQDLINLESSLNKELLRTSRSGAYSSSTINGCNTRKYHGLLICPVPSIDNDPHVLLSSLDETIIEHNSEFNLGIHKFNKDYYSPKGHKYIRAFECEIIPKLTYRVGGILLTKEKVFIAGEDRILIRYTLLESSGSIVMRFKPLMAFRNYHKLCVANLNTNHTYRSIENGIKTSLYDGYPELHMQFSKTVEFIPVPDWYYGVEYNKEQERGYDYKEDLFTNGFFELKLKKGETIIFSAGLSLLSTKGLKQKFNSEIKKRAPRDSFINCLRNSAQQFVVSKNERTDIKAGFPWLPNRGRDTFIALPGLALAIGSTSIFKDTFKNVISDLQLYLFKNQIPSTIQDYDTPDLLLWASWSLQKLTETTHIRFKEFESLFGKAISNIMYGKVARLSLHANGLLHAEGCFQAASWMNAVYNGTPSVQRTGYLVEINALWYNALCFYYNKCSKKCKLKPYAEELIKKIEKSFQATFAIDHKAWLYDYVNPDNSFASDAIRPNMLFAVSLPYSPLAIEKQKDILDIIEKYLLTPRGLRSLAPNEPEFTGSLFGNQQYRDMHYFNGSVWPWLFGSFVDAYLKIYKTSGIHFVSSILHEFDPIMTNDCIGSVSEYYNGNPPHDGDGAVSFAINVTELLRAGLKIDELNLVTTKRL